MVCMWVGMGMLCCESCSEIGVMGSTISTSSGVSPVVLWRFKSPFSMILATSYRAMRHKSYGPQMVSTFLFFRVGQSLERQTKAPVLALMPLIVSPPLPMTSPIKRTGTSTSILWEPIMAPLFMRRCDSTMVLSSFLTLSTAYRSPSTNILRVLELGALEVATCTLMAPDFLAMALMVSPSLPMTSPTHSLGTSTTQAESEGGPQGVVSERLQSPSSPVTPDWHWIICSFFILFSVSSSEKMMCSISEHALETCASVSPTLTQTIPSMRTWRSSLSQSSPVGCAPFPLTTILHPVFSSNCFCALPFGPISSPEQLKLLSLGSMILRLILLASVIIENTPVLSPIGKLVLPSTSVRPSPLSLLAGFSFCMRASFFNSSLEPQRF